MIDNGSWNLLAQKMAIWIDLPIDLSCYSHMTKSKWTQGRYTWYPSRNFRLFKWFSLKASTQSDELIRHISPTSQSIDSPSRIGKVSTMAMLALISLIQTLDWRGSCLENKYCSSSPYSDSHSAEFGSCASFFFTRRTSGIPSFHFRFGEERS